MTAHLWGDLGGRDELPSPMLSLIACPGHVADHISRRTPATLLLTLSPTPTHPSIFSSWNNTMDDDGPTILRPIPRRPFGLNLTTPTPPDEDSSPATPAPSDLANLRFLQPTPEPLSLTRPQSFLNLTSSTLFGIYSPATPSARDRVFDDRDELDTPWGTGAQTPIKRPSVDEATYELMRDRSHPVRRRSSFRPTEPPVQLAPPPSLMSLALRGLLLFLLGVGYGVLVTTTRFHSGAGNLASFKDGMIRPAYNWAHLTFWGVAGVALGALLPWFDRVWEESFGEGEDDVVVVEKDGDLEDLGSSTDWALVIRAVGAFVGIVFAIVSYSRILPSHVSSEPKANTYFSERWPGRPPSRCPCHLPW